MAASTGHVRRPGLGALVREDFERHHRELGSPGFQALAVYRLGRYARERRGVRGRMLRRTHRLLYVFVRNVYGIELPPGAVIGRRMYIGREHGVVLNSKTAFGDDCTLSHNVTTAIGVAGKDSVPTFGDRVKVGPNSVVIGAVHVGDDACIGPNSLVMSDVPPGAEVVAPSTRVLHLTRIAR
jgi:serine O-acetyltransferase